MSGFSSMKKNAQSAIDRLSKEMTKVNSKSSYEDDRFWTLERDKSGNGYAVIRFLAPVEGEDIPWVRLFSHGFQGKGGWMIENCPTTVGKKCPVCEGNTELWNSGMESNKGIARDRKRKLSYIANILVVSDPSNRENEGKVFLYKFGKKIFDKINEKMNPQFEDETPMNPFDLWAGADFKLKIRKVEGYRNYDKSEFSDPAPLLNDDDDMEAIWKTEYSLAELVAPDKFKSYADLKTRLDKVLNQPADKPYVNEEDIPFERPSRPSAAPAVGKTAPAPKRKVEDDDDLDFFNKLAEDDD